jgi:hypothetical protein
MTGQFNTGQQNALITEEIRRAVALFQKADRRVSWLEAALQSRLGTSEGGLLVAFRAVPDQGGGDWVSGTWLTSTKRFWEFEAVVPKYDDEQVDLERLEDVTDRILVSAHVPGTGKSFGFLALDVLDRRR